MDSENGKERPPVPATDTGVKRRWLLRFGTLLTMFTGASAISAFGANSAYAGPGDKNPPMNYVPIAEKGVASGVATLDLESKIPPAQLPDLSATYARVLVPRKYGAVGNGIADDTAALQLMLDDANTGDICELGPAGRIYNINATLLPKTGTTIHSYGAAIRAASAISGAQHIRIGATITNVALDGVVIIASLAALHESGAAIRCDGPANRIINSKIAALTRWGIQVSGVTAVDNTVDGNRLVGSGINFSANGASRTTCSNNYVADSPNNGLSGTGNNPTLYNEDCLVTGNTVLNPGRMGIEDWSKTRRTIIRDNYVKAAHVYAISAVGESTLISGNRLMDTVGSYGIETNASGTKIDLNHIVYAGTELNSTGIMINSVGPSTAVFGCTIANNYVANAVIGIDSTGIGLRGGSVIGNTIENWRTTGISIANAAISSNRFIQRRPRETTRSGILVAVGDTIVGNSFVYEPSASTATGSEIAIRPTSSSIGALIIGNYVDAAYTTLAISSNGSTPANVCIIGNATSGSATFAFGGLVAPIVTSNFGTTSQGNTDIRAGFFGTSPIVKPELTYSKTGESASLAQLRIALTALGIVKDSTTA